MIANMIKKSKQTTGELAFVLQRVSEARILGSYDVPCVSSQPRQLVDRLDHVGMRKEVSMSDGKIFVSICK